MAQAVTKSVWAGRVLAAAGLAALALGASAQERPASVPADADVSDVATMPATTPHRIYLLDSFGGDQARIVDGDTGKLLGGVSAAPLSNIAFAPDQSKIYVAESIWTKGNRGTRQDMVSVYDGTTLNLTQEIAIPGRVYMGVRKQNFALSASGARGYLYNMDPSSSVIVVDLAGGKTDRTVETPGCALVFPFGDDGFSSLCGDGSLATVTLGADGPTLTRTKPFFNAETDPVFENSPTDRKTGKTWFVSYTGLVYETALGAKPTIAKPWSIQVAGGFDAPGTSDRELAWRPGGDEPLTVHRKTGRMFVLMHAGGHWTHGEAGTEIWVLDLAKHTLIKRMKLDTPLDDILVTQDDKPVLYGVDKDKVLHVLDPETGESLRTANLVGGLIFDPAA
ncbi:amine dehydrogenase large subunit [Phenylobacterium sp.]|uniref:amine dehydrogenase large subunit n=1 Tax=Phenylobacterium sp. TaxID=1871053 RepID=UPI0035B1AE87